MIYTVTFNPSLDYIISTHDFQLGKTNRTRTEQMLPGGKGINVSTVLSNLGIPNTALGFIAGFTGKEIEKRVEELGIHHDFITVPNGISRINVKMKDYDGTEINGMGPVIDETSLVQLMTQLDTLQEGDYLILAGSIPESMPDTIYSDILSKLQKKGIHFVVDATKNLLLNVLEYRPFLIKPNNHELGEIFHTELHTHDEVIPYAEKLQKLGARNVLVSMAGDGAVLVSETGDSFRLQAPKGTLVNAVGAGDSMVAGFLAGWIQSRSYDHTFRMSVASGSASAFSEMLATREEIELLFQQLI